MIYIFAGDNADLKIGSYKNFLKTVDKDTEVFQINRKNFDEIFIESMYSGEGLFFKKSLVVFNSILEKGNAQDFILKNLEMLSSSLNDFVFLEGMLLKSLTNKFEKAGARVEMHKLPKSSFEKYNNFLLADALGNKDKLRLWLHYRQAVDLGVGLDELSGVLFWKVKDMILKKNFFKFKEEQLVKMAGGLSSLLPRARMKGVDTEVEFEIFLLNAF